MTETDWKKRMENTLNLLALLNAGASINKMHIFLNYLDIIFRLQRPQVQGTRTKPRHRVCIVPDYFSTSIKINSFLLLLFFHITARTVNNSMKPR